MVNTSIICYNIFYPVGVITAIRVITIAGIIVGIGIEFIIIKIIVIIGVIASIIIIVVIIRYLLIIFNFVGIFCFGERVLTGFILR